MAGNDPQVKDAAIHILCDWSTPDALPLILDLAAAPPTKTIKILALRGLVRLVPSGGRARCEEVRHVEERDGAGRS